MRQRTLLALPREVAQHYADLPSISDIHRCVQDAFASAAGVPKISSIIIECFFRYLKNALVADGSDATFAQRTAKALTLGTLLRRTGSGGPVAVSNAGLVGLRPQLLDAIKQSCKADSTPRTFTLPRLDPSGELSTTIDILLPSDVAPKNAVDAVHLAFLIYTYIFVVPEGYSTSSVRAKESYKGTEYTMDTSLGGGVSTDSLLTRAIFMEPTCRQDYQIAQAAKIARPPALNDKCALTPMQLNALLLDALNGLDPLEFKDEVGLTRTISDNSLTVSKLLRFGTTETKRLVLGTFLPASPEGTAAATFRSAAAAAGEAIQAKLAAFRAERAAQKASESAAN